MLSPPLDGGGKHGRVLSCLSYETRDQVPSLFPACHPSPSVDKEYTLDLVGNRTRLVETKEGLSPVTTTNTYNARDQLLTATTAAVTITYSYDSNGSLIMQVGGGETSTFDWDIRGRLIGATVSKSGTTTVAEYRYTPAGIRSSVTETVNGGQPTTTLHIIDTLGPSGYAQVVEEGRGAVVLGAESEPAADPLCDVRRMTEAVLRNFRKTCGTTRNSTWFLARNLHPCKGGRNCDNTHVLPGKYADSAPRTLLLRKRRLKVRILPGVLEITSQLPSMSANTTSATGAGGRSFGGGAPRKPGTV
jgi:YD repeat-containing protein